MRFYLKLAIQLQFKDPAPVTIWDRWGTTLSKQSTQSPAIQGFCTCCCMAQMRYCLKLAIQLQFNDPVLYGTGEVLPQSNNPQSTTWGSCTCYHKTQMRFCRSINPFTVNSPLHYYRMWCCSFPECPSLSLCRMSEGSTSGEGAVCPRPPAWHRKTASRYTPRWLRSIDSSHIRGFCTGVSSDTGHKVSPGAICGDSSLWRTQSTPWGLSVFKVVTQKQWGNSIDQPINHFQK